jgi:hypothetical protein
VPQSTTLPGAYENYALDFIKTIAAIARILAQRLYFLRLISVH